jgi:aspartyl-tRNA(Asn)/glutamyl-tRNA(Gln) amidotransferase subunit B
MRYQPTIGLEIHSELRTNSKMFCSCKNDPDEKRPNFNVCPVCMGHPGTLPVINKEAVRKVIKTGLAIKCQISENSKFDRKNYFYPDLPKGYQISQYDKPFCKKGFLIIGSEKIGITRVHLEEDTGRLIHPHGVNYSLVDFNRAGIPLMELVTEPDISSGLEARRFAEELQLILRYLGVSDANMEKGQMRVEVNISIAKSSKSKIKKLGTKVEIKNLNSFRAVERAVEYEIKRQAELLASGGKIIQETRGWNDGKGITFSQREKEEAHDYRYFPEPDLPPIHLEKEFIDGIKMEIPELPQERRERLIKEYKIDEKSAEIFTTSKDLGEYFEKVVSEFLEWINTDVPKKKTTQKEKDNLAKIASNYIITDIQGLLGGAIFSEKDFKITPENFAEFITLIQRGEISSKVAKQVLEEMFRTGADPSHIIEEKKLSQMTDLTEIEDIVKEIISKNPKPVQDYKKGKENALQFLAGQVMAQTRGRVKPEIIHKLLKKLL